MINDSTNQIGQVIHEAIKSRASDIHIDPEKDNVKIRFRIDGLLTLHKVYERIYYENIISKIKVDAKMDITDNRFPQDSYLKFLYENTFYNIRVSSLPSIYGEALVLRILNKGDSQLHLDKLGLEPEQLSLLTTMISAQSGMLLITGPTGSGKTNLLYSIINTLNRPERNIITLEDPIENRIEGIRQTQINERIKFSFARALKAVVRQDPNVVMLGEIRDSDTALMAIQASLIGILILSTFHTFDVPALISRLFEMGISNSVVAQSILGVVSSRLVRKICPSCKISYETKNQQGNTVTLYKGKGCENCRNTGYYGRQGIYEVVYFDAEIKNAIVEKKTPSEIYLLLKNKKIKSLRNVAINKIYAGITTVDEVYRVLGPL